MRTVFETDNPSGHQADSSQANGTPPGPASGTSRQSPTGVGRLPATGAMLTEMPLVSSDAASKITADDAVRLRAVPFAILDGELVVALADLGDLGAADEVSILAGMPVRRVGASQELFDGMIREAFGATAAQMAARLGGASTDEDELLSNLQAVEADDLQRMAEQPTLINLVNLIILEAVKQRASDIHIEPFDKALSVKYRIDGMLRARNSPSKNLQPAITSRIKIMAGMNIAERYVPQDGHITLRFEGRKVDIRVSTVPTIYGESVVMRILDKEAMALDLEAIGFRDPDRRSIQRLIDLPHGMVMVTGPTGSGKTTTLYAMLIRLYDPSLKIITIEDPVEYELDGVNQIPVNPERGLSFATGLRSILRQDPDVIMVGEIRDNETADISIRAALTGHLIFSTLHTNDAASATGRLLDMDVEPFLVASVMEGILAQRLGRRLCKFCRASEPINETLRHRLSTREFARFEGGRAWLGRGCEKCDNSGYKGRLGFFEVLTVGSAMRQAITTGRTGSRDLLTAAGEDHVTMREDGLIKAARGDTTVEEVLRATQDTEDFGVGREGSVKGKG